MSLPPPNWSPTGNQGYWEWDERGNKHPVTGNYIGCWKWYDNVDVCAQDNKPETTKGWFKRLFRL